MPHTDDGLIYKNGSTTPKQGVSIRDIQETLSLSYNDIGRLVRSSVVNAFSKVHPQNAGANHIAPLTGQERADRSYGLEFPCYALNNASGLIGDDAVWEYDKGGWYRFDDFDGYYHNAPIALTCVTKGPVVVNSVNEILAESVKFYALSLGNPSSNGIYNKALDPETGIGNSSAIPTSPDRTGRCIAIEDLHITADGFGPDDKNLINNRSKFGFALFDSNNTFKWSFVCSEELVNTEPQKDNNMFILPTNNLTIPGSQNPIPQGEYTAVAFIRVGSTIAEIGHTADAVYVPLCQIPIETGATYPCRFTFRVGGVNLYSVEFKGVAPVDPYGTPDMYSPTLNLTTTVSDIWVYVEVTNNSGVRHRTSPNISMGNWNEAPLIDASGSGYGVYYGDGTSSWTGSRTSSTNLISPTTTFQLEDGEKQMLVYRANRIWNSDPTEQAKVVESGKVKIVQHLYYGNDEFTNQTQITREAIITFG